MQDSTLISTAELRETLGKILDYLDETGRPVLPIEDDFYWSIPRESLFDPYQEPSGFLLEQLSFDLERLEKIREGENDPVGYSLVWLGNVLRAIGERTVG